MHNDDPWVRAAGYSTAADYNQAFRTNVSIERIAGEQNLTAGHIGETTGPRLEAFDAGVEGRALAYDREAVLLKDASDFTDPADRRKFLETRADIIARDYVVRVNFKTPGAVARITQSDAFLRLRNAFYSVIANLDILKLGAKIPTDSMGVEKLLERYPVDKAGADYDNAKNLAKDLNNTILTSYAEADPEGTERLRANNKTVDDFYKNIRGEVNTRVALTLGTLAAAAIYLRTLYDAETIDTQESFAEWAAKKAPSFFASLPAGAAVFVGLHMIASTGPIGAAFVLTAGAAMGYEAIKTFAKNYVTAYPAGKYANVFRSLSDAFVELEKTTVFKLAHEYFKVLGDIANYVLEPITPEVRILTGGTAARLPADATWKIWLVGQDQAALYGNENSNILFHSGFGQALGEGGNDILVGLLPKRLAKGERIWPSENDSPIAEQDLTLTLDGGAGNDWVIAIGGEGAITAGGLGRDWIFNRSNGGVIYGDSPTGQYEKPVLDADGRPVLNADGTPRTIPTQVEDTPENADNIWYSPNTVVKDAQRHDVLKFYGLTLTGGSAEGGVAGLVAFGGVGRMGYPMAGSDCIAGARRKPPPDGFIRMRRDAMTAARRAA